MMTYKIENNNITYTGGEFDGLVEFYNGKVREGYRNVDAPDWLGLEQTLAYTALFQKAIATAHPNMFTVLTTTLQNGKRGEASENFLMFALTNLGITWTIEEKAELNGYLEANNFTIRLT
jgi:hypothetical protein